MMETKTRVEIGSGRDSALNIVYRETEGTIYPKLALILETYAYTRCIHTEETLNLVPGAQLCEPCSEEVLANIRKCIGSGDVEWEGEALTHLDLMLEMIPGVAKSIIAKNPLDKEKFSSEIANIITVMCDTVKTCTHLVEAGNALKTAEPF